MEEWNPLGDFSFWVSFSGFWGFKKCLVRNNNPRSTEYLWPARSWAPGILYGFSQLILPVTPWGRDGENRCRRWGVWLNFTEQYGAGSLPDSLQCLSCFLHASLPLQKLPDGSNSLSNFLKSEVWTCLFLTYGNAWLYHKGAPGTSSWGGTPQAWGKLRSQESWRVQDLPGERGHQEVGNTRIAFPEPLAIKDDLSCRFLCVFFIKLRKFPFIPSLLRVLPWMSVRFSDALSIWSCAFPVACWCYGLRQFLNVEPAWDKAHLHSF